MKLLAMVFISLLAACSSTGNEPVNILDLTSDRSKTEEYWVISSKDHPIYPREALKKGITGCVVMSFTINESGRAENISVTKSFPDNVFDRAAMKALRKHRWTASPNNVERKPVATTMQLDFYTMPITLLAECQTS